MVRTFVCTDLLHLLGLGKILPADQWLMGILYYDPFRRVYSAAQMHFVVDGPGELLGHIPLIHRMTQDTPDRFGIPQAGEPAAFVCPLPTRRRRNFSPVQHLCDFRTAGASQKQSKNPLHHRTGLPVRQQMIFIRRINAVPVGCLPTEKFPLPLENSQRSTHFGAGIRRVQVIEYIFENRHLLDAVGIFSGIILIVHRNKPNPQLRKNLFQIAPGLGIIASQAGKILDDHAPDGARHQAGTELLKARPFKIRAGMSVIHKFPYKHKSVAAGPFL